MKHYRLTIDIVDAAVHDDPLEWAESVLAVMHEARGDLQEPGLCTGDTIHELRYEVGQQVSPEPVFATGGIIQLRASDLP